MIDIVNFEYKGNGFGFFKIYNFKDFNIVLGGDDMKNRKAVESKDVDILMSPEKIRVTDFMDYRDSGLNQVLCKLAKKNNVAVGFSFNEVLEGRDREKILGRMMQNVRLCRKFKVMMVLVSGARNEEEMREVNDLRSFGICIGMTPGEVKMAFNYEKIK